MHTSWHPWLCGCQYLQRETPKAIPEVSTDGDPDRIGLPENRNVGSMPARCTYLDARDREPSPGLAFQVHEEVGVPDVCRVSLNVVVRSRRFLREPIRAM